MTPYFSKFSPVVYDITGTGTQYVIVLDIIRRVQILKALKSNNYVTYPYTVQEGETPEIIAAKLYGSSQYHWLVLFANDVYNIWTEWPLNYENFNKFLISKYGSIAASNSYVHHYEDALGNWIDYDTYHATAGIIIHAYDYELSVNDAKKEILLIDPQYVQVIESQLDSLLNAKNN